MTSLLIPVAVPSTSLLSPHHPRSHHHCRRRRLRLSSSSSSSTRSRAPVLAMASSSPLPQLQELRQGIADFYDQSSGLWEQIWGDHMHHGFYDSDADEVSLSLSNHRAAQIRMIEESLRFASLLDPGETQRPLLCLSRTGSHVFNCLAHFPTAASR